METQLELLTPHKYVKLKTDQRCFIIGDIHGHWSSLRDALNTINFDPSNDMLISVGDIIDRHEDSLKVATWMLAQQNCHVVCGNHEKYFLDYMQYPERGFYYTNPRVGGWWVKQHNKNELLRLAKMMQDRLSLSLTIEFQDKRIGVLHSASPEDWFVVENDLLSSDEWMDYIDNRAQYREAKRAGSKPIRNIDAVVHGHVSSPFFHSGNQFWIDTLHTEDEITLLDLQEIIDQNAYQDNFKQHA